MPINFIDFTKLPIQRSGIAELLPEALQSYQGGFEAAARPGQLQREKQRDELAMAFQQLQNQYYPQLREQELEKGNLGLEEGRLNLRHLPLQLQQEEEKRRLEIERQNQESRYFGREKESLIAEREAATQQHRAAIAKAEYELAKAIHGVGKPQLEGRAFSEMPANERLDAVKRMRDSLKSNRNVIKVKSDLVQMRQITKQYPELYKSFSAVLINPKDSSVLERIAGTFANKKERAAVEKFRKFASDVVSQSLQQGFGSRITDARQNLEEQRKANPNMTPEAINAVIDNMEHDLAPWDDYIKAVRKGLDEGYEVYEDIEAFRKKPITEISTEELKMEMKRLRAQQ